MAVELQLLIPCHVTLGLHHCDTKLEQEEGYLVPVFPFSPLLVVPSYVTESQPSLPSVYWHSTAGSIQITSSAHGGINSHHPKKS